MNKQELVIKLNEAGVNPNRYSLNDELVPDAIVLYRNYHRWLVFYFDERGGRNEEKEFGSETEACEYIFNLFKASEKIRAQFKLK